MIVSFSYPNYLLSYLLRGFFMYLLSHMWHTGTHIFISHKGNIYEKLTEFTDLDYEFGVQLRDTNNYYESNKFEVITEVIMDSDWLKITVDDGPV